MSAAAVPCNGCTACCRGGELIALHPEDGDDVRSYRARRVRSPLTGRMVTAIRQTADGACVYLGDAGCTIYDRRPAICRGFDCRRMLAMLGRALPAPKLLGMIAANPVLQAAVRCGREKPRGPALPGRAPAVPSPIQETFRD